MGRFYLHTMRCKLHGGVGSFSARVARACITFFAHRQDGTQWAETSLTGSEKIEDTVQCVSTSGRPGHATVQVRHRKSGVASPRHEVDRICVHCCPLRFEFVPDFQTGAVGHVPTDYHRRKGPRPCLLKLCPPLRVRVVGNMYSAERRRA